jgi:hypothetical protein
MGKHAVSQINEAIRHSNEAAAHEFLYRDDIAHLQVGCALFGAIHAHRDPATYTEVLGADFLASFGRIESAIAQNLPIVATANDSVVVECLSALRLLLFPFGPHPGSERLLSVVKIDLIKKVAVEGGAKKCALIALDILVLVAPYVDATVTQHPAALIRVPCVWGDPDRIHRFLEILSKTAIDSWSLALDVLERAVKSGDADAEKFSWIQWTSLFKNRQQIRSCTVAHYAVFLNSWTLGFHFGLQRLKSGLDHLVC